MTRKVSLGHLTVIEASPPDLVRIAGAAGYDFVGLRLLEVTPGDAWPIITDRSLLAETKSALVSYGVEVLDVELIRLTPDADPKGFEPMLETAAELGARHVLTQGHDPDWGRLVANFAALSGLAQSFGMTADVEFLTWTGLSTAAQAWALVQEAGQDNAGVMIDTLHFSRSRCDLAELDAIPPERFHLIQISDAAGPVPTTVEGLIFTAREDRLMPGQGDLDLAAIMSRLPANIPVSVEIPNSALAEQLPPVERARSALLATKKLLAQANCSDGRADSESSAR